MTFTSEQDAYILMAHFRCGNRNSDGTWTYFLQSCIEQFIVAFPERFETKNCICKGKFTGRPTVLTVKVVDDIQARIEQSPPKWVRQLSEQTGVSYGSCRGALKKTLHMHPYKDELQRVFENINSVRN